jgi:hypothetical protein
MKYDGGTHLHTTIAMRCQCACGHQACGGKERRAHVQPRVAHTDDQTPWFGMQDLHAELHIHTRADKHMDSRAQA